VTKFHKNKHTNIVNDYIYDKKNTKKIDELYECQVSGCGIMIGKTR
jgi:hypothetical protein